MKSTPLLPLLALTLAVTARAHIPPVDARYRAAEATPAIESRFTLFLPAAAGSTGPTPPLAAPFAAFAPKVGVRWDEKYLYVEAKGLPDHPLMTGIKSWQQQVPIPQTYAGDSAWRIPLHPVPAKEPMSAKTHFMRGAIALAANGVPIFNALNNRGDDAKKLASSTTSAAIAARATTTTTTMRRSSWRRRWARASRSRSRWMATRSTATTSPTAARRASSTSSAATRRRRWATTTTRRRSTRTSTAASTAR